MFAPESTVVPKGAGVPESAECFEALGPAGFSASDAGAERQTASRV